jgi:hypothetical protein
MTIPKGISGGGKTLLELRIFPSDRSSFTSFMRSILASADAGAACKVASSRVAESSRLTIPNLHQIGEALSVALKAAIHKPLPMVETFSRRNWAVKGVRHDAPTYD